MEDATIENKKENLEIKKHDLEACAKTLEASTQRFKGQLLITFIYNGCY